MGYTFDIRTCVQARQFISWKTGILLKDIVVEKAHRKIIVIVKGVVFTINNAPFLYTIPDAQWTELLDNINKSVKIRP